MLLEARNSFFILDFTILWPIKKSCGGKLDLLQNHQMTLVDSMQMDVPKLPFPNHKASLVLPNGKVTLLEGLHSSEHLQQPRFTRTGQSKESKNLALIDHK